MSTRLSRRSLLTTLAAGIGTASVSPWFPAFAETLVADKQRKRHFILLWMSGGPTQTDTFDMKPGHENGGEFAEIETASPGLRFSEHFPKLAKLSDQMAVMRGLSTKEGDHGRGTYLMKTGQAPMGSPIRYPNIGSSLANQLSAGDLSKPQYISVAPFRAFNQDAFSPGFLGPRFGPLFVGSSDIPGGGVSNNADGYPELRVQSLDRTAGITADRMDKRLEMWTALQSEFLAKHQVGAPKDHNSIYQAAAKFMNSKEAQAFDLSQEPEKLREEYGKTVFGQGCLLARRLIENGISVVEVSLGYSSNGVGWDTHSNNFDAVRDLSADLDAGWGTLMRDLKDRGLLESTTILWMGEFGRTPKINTNAGRDHFPAAWSAVLAGGGIAGGQAYGKTSEDGMNVVDGKISVQDLLATLCEAVGIGSYAANTHPNGRPIPISDGTPVKEVLA
ncbi:MAG TPA: DUF1501 domain-containing protein [Planctomycetaceae bacterium]|nr:DUF1501 domain-containing protein [Planctomycetaceae bacterium]